MKSDNNITCWSQVTSVPRNKSSCIWKYSKSRFKWWTKTRRDTRVGESTASSCKSQQSECEKITSKVKFKNWHQCYQHSNKQSAATTGLSTISPALLFPVVWVFISIPISRLSTIYISRASPTSPAKCTTTPGLYFNIKILPLFHFVSCKLVRCIADFTVTQVKIILRCCKNLYSHRIAEIISCNCLSSVY